MHGMVVSGPPQLPYSTGNSTTSRPSSPFALKTGPGVGHQHFATSTSSLSSSFDSDATLCASPDTLPSLPWSDKAQRRSTNSSGSTLAEAAAPEQHLRKFAYRQCALLRERYPTCHIIALPRGARPPSLQVFGCRDQDGERRDEVESYQTILYCGQVEEVVMDFLVFDSGRLEVEAEMYAFASSSWENFGKYIFFDQIAPI